MSKNEIGPGCSGVYNNLFLIIVLVILSWKYPIHIAADYGWVYALLHGLCAPYHWMSSFFKEDVLVIAPCHSDSYMLIWWIAFIIGMFLLIGAFIRIGMLLSDIFK